MHISFDPLKSILGIYPQLYSNLFTINFNNKIEINLRSVSWIINCCISIQENILAARKTEA